MAPANKVFWIGDDGDNKSVSIARKIYTRGQEIPDHEVDGDVLKAWEAKGLISIGEFHAPLIVKDTETVKALEAEIRNLNVRLDAMPALEKQNAELKKSLEKAQSGKKADAVKVLEADVKEKAALIEKLEAEVEALTDPDSKSVNEGSDSDDAAGPGGPQ